MILPDDVHVRTARHSQIMGSADYGDRRSASVFGMLTQIRLFLTAVEAGSIHRAAVRLRIFTAGLT